jgi:D-alanyl-lipoteichoic acid acyltransferase DltB (MBOAT superfamily)
MAFAVFLPIVFILYWAMPHKFRWFLLLVASYYFYMSWNAKYVFLILFTTVISYSSAILLEKQENIRMKKLILAGTAILCLGVLFVFKYFNFVSSSITSVFNLFSIKLSPITVNLLLPVGISFYTFQTLSYVIDVYRGDVKAEKHFGIYATFVSFFPQLVAGPIERSGNLLPQIKSEHRFDYNQAIYGIKLMAVGYYKKLVIADVVGQYVDLAYSDLASYQGVDLALVIFFFTIQIYCDFSGYSDIAIGSAKLMGINLMTNFQSPYFSKSVKEFWSRWHISLSTWFKDYVYIPLGGNRCSKVRNCINLLITFIVSGLWHGASWTFVFWGAIHGVTQIIEKIFLNTLNSFRNTKLGKWIATIVVFIFCNIAWVFFRAETFSDAVYVIKNTFCGISNPKTYLMSSLGLNRWSLLVIFGTIFILMLYDYFNINGKIIEKVERWNKVAQWVLYIVVGLMIVFISQKGVAAEFVYFQF